MFLAHDESEPDNTYQLFLYISSFLLGLDKLSAHSFPD